MHSGLDGMTRHQAGCIAPLVASVSHFGLTVSETESLAEGCMDRLERRMQEETRCRLQLYTSDDSFRGEAKTSSAYRQRAPSKALVLLRGGLCGPASHSR